MEGRLQAGQRPLSFEQKVIDQLEMKLGYNTPLQNAVPLKRNPAGTCVVLTDDSQTVIHVKGKK